MDIQENRIVRRSELFHLTGLTPSALDREIKAGRFPPAFKLSPDPKARSVGWSLRTVQAWISERENNPQGAAA